MKNKLVLSIILLSITSIMDGMTKDEANKLLIEGVQHNISSKVQDALKNNADPNIIVVNGHNNPPVLGIAQSKDIAKLLIDAGANVNATDKNGNTILAIQSSQADYIMGSVEIIKLLLDYHAKVNTSPYSWTELMMTRSPDVAKLLIDAGANINAQAGNGSVLMNAVINAPKVVKTLIDAGADVNATYHKGDTALIFAMESLHPRDGTLDLENIRSLLAAKANVNAANNLGYTPLMMAVSGYVLGPIWVKQQASPEYLDKIFKERFGDYLEMAQVFKDIIPLLLDYKPNTNAKDNDGMTALMHVAESKFAIQSKALIENQKTVIQYLINAGADLNMLDKQNHSALWYANQVGNKEIADFLSLQALALNAL